MNAAVQSHDFEAIMSIDLIREHTKTTDILRVSDEQLSMYRAASIEAAELYTSKLFSGVRTITESLQQHASRRIYRQTTKYTLEYPTCDGILIVVSPHKDQPSKVVNVRPGSRHVRVPVRNEALEANDCCDPYSCGGENFGTTVTYKTGFTTPADIPRGIILGCLKFIAWNVMHAGDEILTTRNKSSTSETGLTGSNNAAVVSGAAEQWRLYRGEI